MLGALSAVVDAQPLDSPLNVLVTGLTATGLVALAVTAVERWRVVRQTPHAVGRPNPSRRPVLCRRHDVVAAYERFRSVVTLTHLDVLHFSLHPFDAPRFAVGFGLIAMHAAVVWGVALLLYSVRVWRRVPRATFRRTSWMALAAAVVVVLAASRTTAAVPAVPTLVAVAMTIVCALAVSTLARRIRRASQAGRLGVLFVVLAAPSLAMYPSLFAFGTAGKERIIETEYAPQALTQRDELRARLNTSLAEIDALPTLVDWVDASREGAISGCAQVDDRGARCMAENRLGEISTHLRD